MTEATFRSKIEDDGFAVLGEVLVREELDRLLENIHQADARRSRAGIRHALGIGPIARLAGAPQLTGLAGQVLGGGAFPFRATLFEKSPLSNWLVAWHQDIALPLGSRLDLPGWGPWSLKGGVTYAHAPASVLRQVLALRVHLDDSTRDNGLLRVLPRTHTNGVLTDDAIHSLSVKIAPVECVVPRGGVLAMRPLLVHASSKSRVGMPRRVLHIEYAASPSIVEPLELATA